MTETKQKSKKNIKNIRIERVYMAIFSIFWNDSQITNAIPPKYFHIFTVSVIDAVLLPFL